MSHWQDSRHPAEVLTPLNRSKDYATLPLDLIALSNLAPPSPVLSPVGLDTSWSLSELPIEFDLEQESEASESPPLTSYVDELGHATEESGIICSPSATTIDTVDTFGGTGRRRAFQRSRSFSPISQQLNEPLVSTEAVLSTLISLPQYTPQPSAEGADEADHVDEKMHLCSGSRGYCFRSTETSLHQTPLKLSAMCYQQNEPPQVTPPTIGSPFALDKYLPVTTLKDDCLSAPSSPSSYRIISKPLISEKNHNPPTHLEWLQKTTVELLIDQEGFRAVLARFKFMRCTCSESRSGNSEPELVQFRPIHRQVFLFHYAPLDGPPVLRRIATNGEETRDYISKQASLGLKVNGVYFVSGAETLSFPLPNRQSKTNSKLQWRFEYAVDDKGVVGLNRKTHSGEKTLTPLSFSCSPLLLHPLQGKRVRLMHVVKKSVTAKLVAQRMRPPGLDNVFSQVDDAHLKPAIVHSSKDMSSHQALRYGYDEDYRGTEQRLPSSITTIGQDICHTQSSRRRRASSAGEVSYSRNIASLCTSAVELPYCGNIIPPSRLISLMEAPDHSLLHKVLPASIVASDHSSLPAFKPLSPRPRHN